MTIKPDADGNLYTMLDCPMCDKAGPHYLAEGRHNLFQCDQCMAMFGDGELPMATWLPN